MGALVLRRPSDWGGRLRRLTIFVDGTQVAALRPNESHLVEVSAGRHEVRGQMDWATCAPLSVDVTVQGRVDVEVSLPFASFFKTFVSPKRAVQVRLLP